MKKSVSLSFSVTPEVSLKSLRVLGLKRVEVHGGVLLTDCPDEELANFQFDDFLKRFRGVFFKKESDASHYTIYTDIFLSVPLYHKVDKNEIVVTSDFSSFLSNGIDHLVIDKAGFWECLLFGSGLHDRTLYSGITQFVSASYLVINQKLQPTIRRYWDFNFELSNEFFDSNDDEVVAHLIKLLEIEFQKCKTMIGGDTYLGLSGGMDSRLALAMLHFLGLSEEINYVTYGYSEKILEVDIAKELFSIFGGRKWEFHKLSSDSYRLGLKLLPFFSGGSVSSAHSHLFSFFYKSCGKTLLSTYYTDALFGYSATKSFIADSPDDVDYMSVLKGFQKDIPQDTYQMILSDINKVVECYEPKRTYTNVNEYKYIVERTPKFHMNLLFQQSQLVNNVCNPFLSFSLLEFMQQLPPHYRHDKKLIRRVIKSIDNRFINSVGDSSNQRVYFQKTVGSLVKNIFTNPTAVLNLSIKLVNACLFYCTRGRLYIRDYYATETHSNILASSFRTELKDAVDYFVGRGLLSKELGKNLKRVKPYGKSGIIRFHILDLYSLRKEL